MATGARSGFNTKVYRGGTGGPGVQTGGALVEEVIDVDLPEALADQIEVTSHDSTKAEFISSYVDEGTITVTVNYKEGTNQELLRGDNGAAVQGYYVNLPGGATQIQIAFLCNVHSWKFSVGMKEQIKGTAKLKITGPVAINVQG